MTVVSQPGWMADLVEVLDQQRALYRQLRDLCDDQAELVEVGDPEPLLALMSRRQAVIDRLAQVSGRLEPYREDWNECWEALDAPSRQRVAVLVRDIQQLLELIMNQDERDRSALAARRRQMADSLNRMRQGASIHRAYGQQVDPTGSNRFTDRQG